MNATSSSFAHILKPDSEAFRLLAEALRAGEVVGMPTETVYGLAGDAFNPDALARIFSVKDRPTFDPLIVHVSAEHRSLQALAALRLIDVSRLSALAAVRATRMIDEFWPGPLTLVLPKAGAVPDLATSGFPTVAVRMPRHPVAQSLLRAAGTPLAAPSANRFGRISPTSAQAVVQELGDRIRYVLDGGACEVGLESTVVGVAPSGELTLFRPGGVPASEIERVTGCGLAPYTGGETEAPSPGTLESHYAPRKPLFLLPAPVMALRELDVPVAEVAHLGLLVFSGDPARAASRLSEMTGRSVTARSLSARGDLAEAAKNLFSEMRFLDSTDATALLAEPCPTNEGLGHAISDRLRRASLRLP